MEIYKVKHEKCFPKLHYKIKKNNGNWESSTRTGKDDTVPETLDVGTSFRFKLIQVKNQGLDGKIKH